MLLCTTDSFQHQSSHSKAQLPQKRRTKKPCGGTMRKHLSFRFPNPGFRNLQEIGIKVARTSKSQPKSLLSLFRMSIDRNRSSKCSDSNIAAIEIASGLDAQSCESAGPVQRCRKTFISHQPGKGQFDRQKIPILYKGLACVVLALLQPPKPRRIKIRQE